MVVRLTTTLGLLGLATPAFAAVDVVPSITAPSGTHVYETGRWYVTVNNTGNSNASSVTLTVTLPQTNTSPGTYVMGTVGAKSSSCSLSGVTMTCSLGTVRRRSSSQVYVDIAFPESVDPLDITATVSTTSSESSTAQANNTTTTTASPLNYDVSFGTSIDTLNRHCTGTNLASFFECELYPSSISEHQAVLNSDGSISFPTESSDYGGSWESDAPDHLIFEYTYLGAPVANFEGWGVSTDCWEGLTTFDGSTYVAPYEVCVQ